MEFLIDTLPSVIGSFVAFLLGFLSADIIEKWQSKKQKKHWQELLDAELSDLMKENGDGSDGENHAKALSESSESHNDFEFINAPVISEFCRNPQAQILFDKEYLVGIFELHGHIEVHNKYVENILMTKYEVTEINISDAEQKILELANKVKEFNV